MNQLQYGNQDLEGKNIGLEIAAKLTIAKKAASRF